MDVSTSSKCQESDLGILCTTEVHPGNIYFLLFEPKHKTTPKIQAYILNIP